MTDVVLVFLSKRTTLKFPTFSRDSASNRLNFDQEEN